VIVNVPSTDPPKPPFKSVSAFIGGPDPRPSVIEVADRFVVAGMKCLHCHYPIATVVPWCPKCHNDVAPATFGPDGTVWASTVLHVPVPGQDSPFMVAYVDLDHGPRVLAHMPGDQRTPAKARVRLTAPTDGQLNAEAIA
jgi:hypothetical protein